MKRSIADDIRSLRTRIQQRLHDEHGTTVEDDGGVIRGAGGHILVALADLAGDAEEDRL